MSDYKISDEDVDGVIRYMQIYHPEKATPEYCRALLEYVQSTASDIGRTDPDELEKLYEQFEAANKD